MEITREASDLVKSIEQSIRRGNDLDDLIKEKLPEDCSPSLALELHNFVKSRTESRVLLPIYEYLYKAFKINAVKLQTDWLAKVGTDRTSYSDVSKFIGLQQEYEELINKLKPTYEQKQK